jgi:hypothetical protein
MKNLQICNQKTCFYFKHNITCFPLIRHNFSFLLAEICPVTWHHVIYLRTCDIEHVTYWHTGMGSHWLHQMKGQAHRFIKLLLCTVFYIQYIAMDSGMMHPPSHTWSESGGWVGKRGDSRVPPCACIWGDGEGQDPAVRKILTHSHLGWGWGWWGLVVRPGGGQWHCACSHLGQGWSGGKSGGKKKNISGCQNRNLSSHMTLTLGSTMLT